MGFVVGQDRKIARRVAAFAAVAVAVLAVPGTAQAAPPLENVHHELAESSSVDDCRFTVESDFTTSGHFMLREIEGSAVRRSSGTTTAATGTC